MIKMCIEYKSCWSLGEDIGVSGINDGQSWTSMIFTAGSTQSNVVSSIENDFSLGNSCVVFEFSFSDGWAVVAQYNELGFTWSQSSEGWFISEDIFSTFHDEGKFAVDVLWGGFLDHLCFWIKL